MRERLLNTSSFVGLGYSSRAIRSLKTRAACYKARDGTSRSELITYGGVNHFPSVQVNQNKWLEWIKERLSVGAAPRAGCTKSRMGGLSTELMVQNPFPNFLTGWADATDGQRYNL